MKGTVDIYYGVGVIKTYTFNSNYERKQVVTKAIKDIERLSKGLKYIDIKYDEPIEYRQSKQYPIQQLNAKGEVLAYFTTMNEAAAKTGISKESILQSVIKERLFAKKYYFKKLEI